MKLRHPAKLTFERADGARIICPAPSREQMREVYALDPDGAEDPNTRDARRAAQIGILLRHATCTTAAGEAQPLEDVLGALTAPEEHDIVGALVALHHGYDPATAVELQAALREIARSSKKKPAA
jgi:hypothetical protein